MTDTNDSPFDNAQVAVHANQLGPDYAARTSGVFFKSISLLIILGLGAAWFFVWRPNHAARAAQQQEAQTTDNAAVGDSLADKLSATLKGAIGSDKAPSTESAGIELDQAKQQAAADKQQSQQSSLSSAPVAYEGSFTNIIDGKVTDETGKDAGMIYDILVDRETGASTAVVINNQKKYQGLDLSAVKFNEVAQQDSSGNMKISADAGAIAASPSFSYEKLPSQRYVSLRSLENGQVLDDQNKNAGQIDAVIYYNGSAQNIVFTVPPIGNSTRKGTFVIPYKDVEVLAGAEGNAIRLNNMQTAALASAVIPKSQ